MLLCHQSLKGIGWKKKQRPSKLEINDELDKYIYILNGTKWDNFIVSTSDRRFLEGCSFFREIFLSGCSSALRSFFSALHSFSLLYDPCVLFPPSFFFLLCSCCCGLFLPLWCSLLKKSAASLTLLSAANQQCSGEWEQCTKDIMESPPYCL